MGHRRLIGEVLGSATAGLLVTLAYTSSELRLWDLATLKELRLLDEVQLSAAGATDLSPDGRILAIADGGGQIHLWTNLLGQKLTTARLDPDHADPLTCLAIDATGRLAAVGSRRGVVTLWDIASRRMLRRLTGHSGSVYDVAFSAGGLVASAGADGTVRVWDARAGRPIGPPLSLGGGQVLALAFDRAGPRLAAGSDDRRLVIWDTGTWRSIRWPSAPALAGPIRSLAFSPDGATLAVAGADDRGPAVQLRDAATGQLLQALTAGPDADAAGPFLSVAFRPDGRQVVATCRAVGRKPFGAVVWDARSGAVLHLLRGHLGTVYQANFSPDGRRIVTAGDDRTVKLWDTVLGAETLELRRDAPVAAAALTPDGFRLLAADRGGLLALWDATPADSPAGQNAASAGAGPNPPSR